jgi:hypothetical protein
MAGAVSVSSDDPLSAALTADLGIAFIVGPAVVLLVGLAVCGVGSWRGSGIALGVAVALFILLALDSAYALFGVMGQPGLPAAVGPGALAARVILVAAIMLCLVGSILAAVATRMPERHGADAGAGPG